VCVTDSDTEHVPFVLFSVFRNMPIILLYTKCGLALCAENWNIGQIPVYKFMSALLCLNWHISIGIAVAFS